MTKKFKHKGIKIKRVGNLIMFLISDINKIYFTDVNYLKSILYGTREYIYANMWYERRNKNNTHKEAKPSVEGDIENGRENI